MGHFVDRRKTNYMHNYLLKSTLNIHGKEFMPIAHPTSLLLFAPVSVFSHNAAIMEQ